MTWTTPYNWSPDELITETLLNEMTDNDDYLFSRPYAAHVANEGSDYTTTSSSFATVDNTDFALTVTLEGTVARVSFDGEFSFSTNDQKIRLNVSVDGVDYYADDGIGGVDTGTATSGTRRISFARLLTGLTPGARTFRLRWKTSAGTATLYAGAGTSGRDVHPQFDVIEVSNG